MRHRKAGLKLNRTSSHREAMFRNMVTSLFKHDRIRTTNAKAKELRRWADRLITLAKDGSLHARRKALSIIREKKVVYKLFEEAKDRFGSISGGYTRITKVGRRAGDAAPVSIIELVDSDLRNKIKEKKADQHKKRKDEPGKETVESDDVSEEKEIKEDTDEKKTVESEEIVDSAESNKEEITEADELTTKDELAGEPVEKPDEEN